MNFTQYSDLAKRTLPEKNQEMKESHQGYLVTAYLEIKRILAIVEPIKKHVFHGHDIPSDISCYPINDSNDFPDISTTKINVAIGLVGEACEAAIKILEENSSSDIGDELGDVLWYLNGAALTHGLRLDEIASFNIHKLRKRYPNGFDEKKSQKRTE